MADLALADDYYYTYRDYKDWNFEKDGRFELIDGEAYAMSAPTLRHQAVVVELVRQIANFLHGKPCKVYPAPLDVRLFYEEDESDDTVLQPDLSVICDPKKRGAEGCRGAPDLVIEVLSPSNTDAEMRRKFVLYRKAGVREYWVVSPEKKTAAVYIFDDGGGTTEARTYGATDIAASTVLAGLEIALESVFAE